MTSIMTIPSFLASDNRSFQFIFEYKRVSKWKLSAQVIQKPAPKVALMLSGRNIFKYWKFYKKSRTLGYNVADLVENIHFLSEVWYDYMKGKCSIHKARIQICFIFLLTIYFWDSGISYRGIQKARISSKPRCPV